MLALLLAETAPATQNFFQTLGQLRSDARSIGTVNLNDLTAIYGRNPCVGLACATLPAGLQVQPRRLLRACRWRRRHSSERVEFL